MMIHFLRHLVAAAVLLGGLSGGSAMGDTDRPSAHQTCPSPCEVRGQVTIDGVSGNGSGGLVVGAPAGGAQGPGTINAERVSARTTNGVVSFDGVAGATPDLVELAVILGWSNGNTTLTVGSSLSTTGTVTTAQGSNVLTITGSTPLTFATHQRNPIAISLTGGVTWSGVILAVQNGGGNQTVTLSTSAPISSGPLSGASIIVGTQFTAADIGKLVAWTMSGPGKGSGGGTITGVTSANVVTVSGATSPNSDATNPQFFWVGTDNYTALSTAVQTAIQTNSRKLMVNGKYLVSKLPSSITRVHLVGGGQILNLGGSDSSPPQYSTIPVIADTAPAPVFENQVPATVMALLSSKKGGTIRVAEIGASTGTEDPGTTGMQGSWRGPLLRRLQAANPTTTFKVKYFAQGGASLCAYYSACSYPGGALDWVTSTSTPWIGGPWTAGYVYNFDGTPPDLVVMEISANDVAGTAQIAYLEALWAHFQLWTTPPALIVVLDPNYGYNTPNFDMAWFRSWSRLLRGWGAIRNVGIIDYHRGLQQLRNGVDPVRQYLERVPANTGTLNGFGGYIPVFYSVEGWMAGFTYSGTPAALWSAAGNLLTGQGGGANDNTNFDVAGNVQWGLDGGDSFPGGTTNQIYMRADLGRAEPGGALRGGTVPFVYGSISISASSNALAYAPYSNGPTSPFTSGNINGKLVTVPGAGSTSTSTGTAATVRAHPVPPGGTTQGPLVAYAQYIDGTHIQLFSDAGLTTPANAVTAVSNASPSFLMLGSPRVYTGLTPSSSGTTLMQVWVREDDMGIQVNSDSQTFRATIARPTKPAPLLFNFNGTVAASWDTASGGLGMQNLWIARSDRLPIVQASMSDDFLLGCTSGNPNACPGGGSGGNHPAAGMNEVWARVTGATQLQVP